MDPEKATPRARAMWGYSRLGQPQLAALCDGVGYHRLRAILSVSNASDVSLEELYAIAAAAGVPASFAEQGFLPAGDEVLRDRVSRLERDLEVQRVAAAERATEVQQRFDDMQRTMSHLQRRQRP